MSEPERYHDNLTHLQGALLVLNLRLHRQVLRWRATHHPEASPDELLGLTISDRETDAVLDALYAAAAPPQSDEVDSAPIAVLTGLLADAEAEHLHREAAALGAGVLLRLLQLAQRLGLNGFERQVVLLALAPELERGYERLFTHLNDDATRRCPTVSLALQLFCHDMHERSMRRTSFAPAAPLRSLRVVALIDEPPGEARALLAAGLKLDEYVVGYLLGADSAGEAHASGGGATAGDPPPDAALATVSRRPPLGAVGAQPQVRAQHASVTVGFADPADRPSEANASEANASEAGAPADAPAPAGAPSGASASEAGPPPPALTGESLAAAAGLRAHYARRQGAAPILSLSGPDRELQVRTAAWLAEAWDPDCELLLLDGAGLAVHPDPEDIVARALREARLEDAALVVGDADMLQNAGGRAASALGQFLRAECPQPRFLLAEKQWTFSGLPFTAPWLTLELPAPDREARRQLWSAALNGSAPRVELAELADRYRLTSSQIAAAAAHAIARAAASRGDPRSPGATVPGLAELYAACRAQSANALAGLAQRIDSIYTWDDLVLPPAVKAQLRSLEDWMRYRHVVYGEWGYDQRMMLGRGLAVLFSGPSGTGKTMAAGILARNLALDLYRIDLSTVVSKYIGETEKNLSRVFEVAESANAILFFDEADALFGKRSEVKDAHDRYANIEVSYLLQRMEAYQGMAVLATNFRENLDQAFARRLHVTVTFPFPQAPDRERIWRGLLPPEVPQSDDIDMGYLAGKFALAGGSIRNCVLAAAFAAAAEKNPVQMRHLVQAVARELEKMDQPVTRSDFGPHYELLRAANWGDGSRM